MTEAGVARQCLGAVVRDEVLVLITPVPPRRRRRLSRHQGGASVGLERLGRARAPRAMSLWRHRQPSLSR
jgi:hypothetical protein